ncbi:MAG: hypothetical protein KVP17_003691 [Porospora cf. gigantea B]|nr:MAG: hypothetical protein KVP17_003691 [Porospora cf. gigantea B]
MVVDCDDCLTQMKCNFERVINSELLGLHVLMTEEDMASIVACKHAAEQEPHNRQLGRGGGTADCPPIWRSDLDRTLHSPPLSPDSTDNDPIDKDPDLDTTLVPSGWAERADYAQQYLLPDAFPNSFVPPGRETYQTTCAVHTIPKLTPSRLPITSNPFDLMADVLVDTIRGAFLRNPSKASTTEVKSIGLEHLRVGLIVRRPFK